MQGVGIFQNKISLLINIWENLDGEFRNYLRIRTECIPCDVIYIISKNNEYVYSM